MEKLAFSKATLADIVRWRAQHQSQRNAFTFLLDGETQEARWSYADVDLRAQTIQSALQSLLPTGERALLMYPPGLEYIAAFLGCLYAGIVAVPMYPPRNNRSLQRLQTIVQDAKASVVLTTDAIYQSVAAYGEILPELNELRWVATDLIANQQAAAQPISAQQLAFIQYTSGSTGQPKGVMLSHANLLHNLELIQAAFQHTPDSCGVIWLPPYHDMGLIGGILQPLFAGFPVVLMSPTTFLQRPLRWLEAITRYRATTSGGPDFAYALCAQRITPEQRQTLDLSSWRLAFNGAEPIRAATIEQFSKTFAPHGFQAKAFYPCYGLAEATLLVTGGAAQDRATIEAFDADALQQNQVQAVDSANATAQSLVGTGYPQLDLAIIDPITQQPCRTDQVGEIWVAGKSVAQGYWNQPTATQTTFNAWTKDGQGPYLRTGDLGFLWQNELFVTGRIKDLIVVRGRNFYPHDLEYTATNSHPALLAGGAAAFSIDVTDREQVVIVHELERRERHGDHHGMAQAIRQAVAEQHELQVHTIAFLKPGGLPKTSSGKVQRQQCRRQFIDGSLDVLGVDSLDQPVAAATLPDAADGEIMANLRQSISKILQLPAASIDPAQPLTTLGLDSLAALEIAHLLERNWQLQIDMGELLAGKTLHELGEQLQAQAPTFELAIDHVEAAAPATYGQRALWFLHELNPTNTAYHIARVFEVKGDLDVQALQQALNELVIQHAGLRTSFAMRDDEVWQEVDPDATVTINLIDGRTWSEDECQTRVQALIKHPFDLATLPLFRVHVVQRGSNAALMVMVFHHIIVDLWSLILLLEEFRQRYTTLKQGARLPINQPSAANGDAARWQATMLSGTQGADLANYWRQKMAAPLPILELATDYLRPALQTTDGAQRRFMLSVETTQRLKALAQHEEVTLYVLLITLYATFLGRMTNQDELLIGTPVAGRNRAAHATAIGYYVNSLVIRILCEPHQSLRAMLLTMRQTVLEALQHQDFPFAMLVEQLVPQREPGRTPLFQTMFTLERPQGNASDWAAAIIGAPVGQVVMADLELTPYPLDLQSVQHDLTLTMVEVGQQLHGVFEYRTDLFSSITIDRYIDSLQCVIESALEGIDQLPSELAVFSPSAWQHWNNTWNATDYPYPASTIDALFSAQAQATPTLAAVIDLEQQLTYSQLHEQSNQLAGYLQTLGVKQETLVGIYLEPSVAIPLALLAILKAGGAYVPLDLAYPTERIKAMLSEANIQFIVTDSTHATNLPPTTATIIMLDQPETIMQLTTVAYKPTIKYPDQLAYVLFTSGSTGQPKGVAGCHRGVINLLESFVQTSSTAGTHRSCLSSLSFDVSIYEIIGSLLSGGTLYMASTELRGDISASLDWLRSNGIQNAFIPPFMVEALSTTVQTSPSEWSLQEILVGVEPIREAMLDSIRAALPQILITNAYGPTETTVCSLVYRFETTIDPARITPIGQPLANTSVYILDSNQNPSPIGSIGEVYIGGVGLARGYLGNPWLTAQRFIPDPFGQKPGERLYRTGDLARLLVDGSLLFIGRNDQQIKLHGVRIELGDIEAVMNRYPDVAESVAMVQIDANQHKYLIGYIAHRLGQEPDQAALRRYLQAHLPPVMVPRVFVNLEALPRSANGKIDRRALPTLDWQQLIDQQTFTAPRTALESKLAAIWSDVLGIPTVGIHDDFFMLGGHSLMLTQLRTRIQDRLGIVVPLQLLFQSPTIAEQAESLDVLQWMSEAPPALDQIEDELEDFTL